MSPEASGSSPPPATAPAPRLQRGLWLLRWAAVLFVVVGALVAVSRLLLDESLSEEQIQAFVAQFGFGAPLAFIALFAIIGSLIVPTTVLAVVGVTFFGTLPGFLYSMVGGFLAAMLGFTAARTLGRQAVSRWLSKHHGKIARFDRRLEQHGFSTALFMRLLYLPNGLINVVCGVSGIPAAVYAGATLLGMLPMVFAITFLTGGAKQALLDGDWEALLEPETIFAVLLFLVCLSAPFVSGAIQRHLRARELVRHPIRTLSGVFDRVEDPDEAQGDEAADGAKHSPPAGHP